MEVKHRLDRPQEEVDDLADELKAHAQLAKQKYFISQGFDHDPDRINAYLESVEKGLGWRHHLDQVVELASETRELLSEAEPVVSNRNTEERRYRLLRKRGRVPQHPSTGDWRTDWNETAERDWERDDEADGANAEGLIRTYTDVLGMAQALSNYEEVFGQILPDEEDAEILEGGEGNQVQGADSPLEESNRYLEEFREEFANDVLTYHISLTDDMIWPEEDSSQF